MRRSYGTLCRASALALLLAVASMVGLTVAPAEAGPLDDRGFERYWYADPNLTQLVGYALRFCDGTTSTWGYKTTHGEYYWYTCPV